MASSVPSSSSLARAGKAKVGSKISSSSVGQRPAEPSLLQKLASREQFGHLRRVGRSHGYSGTSSSKLFTRLPGRLAFCLKDVVPMSAIEAGHVFLGFSKCGQFLLSYTMSTADVDLVGGTIYYHYRLHWWLFLPYKRAKKVAEMLLFSNEGAAELLHLSFCQWPRDDKKLVVFGYPLGSNAEDVGRSFLQSNHSNAPEDSPMSSRRCYFTVTAVPSLKGCKDCVRVAESYEEDDVAEAWNSCVRLSCLEHGLTVHTAFDLVPPFPKFEPKISLKRDNYALINTGNVLHSLHICTEKLQGDTDGEESAKSADFLGQILPKSEDQDTKPDLCRQWSELNVATGSEFTLYGGEVFSPPHTSASLWSPGSSVRLGNFAPGLAASDSETTDGESDCGATFMPSKSRLSYVQDPDRLRKVAEFVEKLNPSPPGKHQMMTRRKRSLLQNDRGEDSPSSKRLAAAEKAYALTEDEFNEAGVQEKLSTFRKKRLAEKTYEFKEDDHETVITPLPRLRSQKSELHHNTPPPPSSGSLVTAATVTEDQATSLEEDSEMCLSEEVSGLMVDTIPVPELLSPGGMVKKEAGNSQLIHSPRSDPQQPPKFHAKFTRRYIELDDELISVITDIEDDEMGSVANSASGFFMVLPLEVHGSGYQAMSMISKSKAEKLTRRCIRIQQHSLDLEVFCHYMAQRLCQAANKKYWFCNDYDVEVVDLDPVSGDVICVAVVLVKATIVTKKVSQASQHQQRYSISSLHRHQYQGSFKFCWNIDTAHVSVIDWEPLKELGGNGPSSSSSGVWHPAKSAALALQRSWGVLSSHHSQATGVKCFTNDPVLKEMSLATIVDSEHLVAIIQDNLD